jgi:glycosyltransferase involved in cell wall biosynthesis
LADHTLPKSQKYLLFVVNVDWFFVSHRISIARRAQQCGYRIGLATTVTDKQVELEAEGIEVFPLKLPRSSASIAAAISLLFQLITIIRKVKPDIVHLVTIKPVLIGGFAARLLRVRAMVAAISGLGYVFVSPKFSAWLIRIPVTIAYRIALAHKKATIIFQNSDDRDVISKLTGLAQQKSVLIRGSGVNLSQFVATPLPQGRPVVMMAARLLIDKGVREFVEAAKVIRNNNTGKAAAARFVLVGDADPGNAASISPAELESIRAEQVVELWGHQQQLENVLPEATLVVLPSYREGLPKVLIEAAACGRAVVTTNVPGCRDAIEVGVTGKLVPHKNAQALAACISQLLNDPDQCAAMGRAGRELAERHFDEKMIVERHIEVYEKLSE